MALAHDEAHIDFKSAFWADIEVLVDSRDLLVPAKTVFFALQGISKDGHDFIPTLYRAGVRKFVVQQTFDASLYKDAEFVFSASPLKTLQHFAAFHREQFNIPVIAITGSNGKTIVKEWLYQLLEGYFKICKSPKSYNSQLGVPLSVLKLNEAHTLGIFEAGISQVGEMEALENILKPTIGAFTNLGSAHDEGFRDGREQKLAEKSTLFAHSDKVIYKSGEAYSERFNHLSGEKIHWGAKEADTLQLLDVIAGELLVLFESKKYHIPVPFTDKASVENLMLCLTVGLTLGCPFEGLIDRVKYLKNIPMRLEIKDGINNTLLIDDTYNNDLAGLEIALSFASRQAKALPLTLVISDLLESGYNEEELFTKLYQLLRSYDVRRLVGIGQKCMAQQHAFDGVPNSVFPSVNAFLESEPLFKDEVVLLKGARDFHFEKIVSHLQKKVHGTRLEVNLSALAHNLNFYRALLSPTTKMMVMVKAFGYGSGGFEVANRLASLGVDYLAVAYTDEGVALREAGITVPIMVMNPALESLQMMLSMKLEPEVYSASQLVTMLADLAPSDKLRVHVKIDTGMKRLGFDAHYPNEIDALLKVLTETSNLEVVSVMTHLAGADGDEHRTFTLGQLAIFEQVASRIEKELGYTVLKHALNSAGIVKYTGYEMDMVRLGIGLYGVDSSQTFQDLLRPVATLKSQISQIKEVKAGESVGYGRRWIAPKDSIIATIPIGYADGYDRRFSLGVGKMSVKGKLVSTVGNVCMDMTMVDVTAIDGVAEGDEVIVFGDSPSWVELADAVGTIPYELLTNVNLRVKRVFYEE